jgi:uncharacterized membrane protein
MLLVVSAGATLALYAAAEAVWLASMSQFYARQFAGFSRPPLALRSLPAAIAVYAVLLSTFALLVCAPIVNASAGAAASALRGAAFGLAAYGTYNLTNMATLPGYSWTMVAVDTLWGAALFAALAATFAATLHHRRRRT